MSVQMYNIFMIATIRQILMLTPETDPNIFEKPQI